MYEVTYSVDGVIMKSTIPGNDYNQIFQAIQKCDIVVDKQELIKALQYDRGQYEKGYNDGLKAGYEKAKAELLEKITESIEKGFE